MSAYLLPPPAEAAALDDAKAEEDKDFIAGKNAQINMGRDLSLLQQQQSVTASISVSQVDGNSDEVASYFEYQVP